jgi:hypothetical protein
MRGRESEGMRESRKVIMRRIEAKGNEAEGGVMRMKIRKGEPNKEKKEETKRKIKYKKRRKKEKRIRGSTKSRWRTE